MKYTCVRCGKEFEAKHRTTVCNDCHIAACVVCGKDFVLKHPWTQKTCSAKCRGVYRRESGIAKASYEKASATLEAKYGVSNASHVSKPSKTKICRLCGKEFIPDTNRQVYCKDTHYGPCPICGKTTEIKDMSIGPQACSEACRQQRISNTCMERYGNSCVLNSDYGKSLRKQTCLDKYGVDSYSKTDDYKTKYTDTMVSRYGVAHPLQNPEIKMRVANTNIARYGGASPMCDDSVRAKAVTTVTKNYGGFGFSSPVLSKQIQSTMLAKYGVDTAAQIPGIQDTIKHTNLQRYGVESPMQSLDIQAKQCATMYARYGVEYIWQDAQRLAEIRKKSAQTMLERYGVTNASYSNVLKDKASQTFMERYGVPWYVLTDDCSTANNHSRISKVNKQFAEILDVIQLPYTMEFCVAHKFFDFKAGNVLIELNPTITHNSYLNIFSNSEPLHPEYHVNKSKLATDNGYHCIHVFDWDNIEQIVSLLLPKTAIYARDCVVQRVDEKTANLFTTQYHIQGSCRGQKLNYGLYYNGELVEIMTFGKPRYNKRYTWELLRLCSKSDVRVVGGASKLFKQFTQQHAEDSVISYCDLSKFSGSVYSKIGMTQLEVTPPAKVWSYKDKRITDNLLRQRGFDQLFNTNYGKGTNNEELMLSHGWLPVYDCGQGVYTWCNP